MVSKFLQVLNRDVTTLNQAALVLGIFSFLSQVLGLLRDHLLASMVGPSRELDVYYAAFRIPDFIYTSVAVLFSVTVIIPFVTKYLQEEEGKKAAEIKKFFDSIFTVYTFGMVGICIIIAIFMPFLTRLTAPGFSATQHADLVLFSRIMLLSPFLLGLSSLFGSFAQIQKKFFSFAIAPLFYNFGILIGIIGLLPLMGLLGVVLGVVIGAALYLLVQIPTLLTLHKLPILIKRPDWALVKKVMTLSLPRTLASSLSNVTFVIMSALASLLVAGSISIFQFAYNIETTPLMIVGISYAVAVFPTLTRLHAEGQKKAFMDMIHRATRNIFIFAVPASLLIIVLRAQIVRVLLGAGNFSLNDTKLVAACVALFSISVTAQCMTLLLIRGFYAVGNTKTPLKINTLSVVFTAIAAGLLLLGYHESLLFQNFIEDLLRIDDVVGGSVILLPLAFSIGQIGNAFMLWLRLHAHLEGTKKEQRSLARVLATIVAAGIIAATGTYGTLALLGDEINQANFISVILQGAIAGLVGLILYVCILLGLKNEDIILLVQSLKSKFWKQKPMVIQQQQL